MRGSRGFKKIPRDERGIFCSIGLSNERIDQNFILLQIIHTDGICLIFRLSLERRGLDYRLRRGRHFDFVSGEVGLSNSPLPQEERG